MDAQFVMADNSKRQPETIPFSAAKPLQPQSLPGTGSHHFIRPDDSAACVVFLIGGAA